MSEKFRKYSSPYGSAPVELLGDMIMMSPEAQKEWDTLDDDVKKTCTQYLEETCIMMGNKQSIQLLCHVIKQMQERISLLEEKLAEK